MASISNQAQVSYSYDGSTRTRSKNSNIVNSTILEEFDFSVSKTSSRDCYRLGDTITYFVEVQNTGCGCLRNFQLTDNLGDNNSVTYVEGSARIIIGGDLRTITPTSVSPLVINVSDRISRDGGVVVVYNVEVNEELGADVNEITNTVDVLGYPCGCDTTEEVLPITRSATSTITRCEFAEILITKQANSDTYCCSDEIEYFITLTNTGTIDATNVVVTDSLPENFVATEIYMENNGVRYVFDPSEYTIDEANLLTLPNATGTAILVPAVAPGIDNTTRIRIQGHI